jgi:hypothetical protein
MGGTVSLHLHLISLAVVGDSRSRDGASRRYPEKATGARRSKPVCRQVKRISVFRDKSVCLTIDTDSALAQRSIGTVTAEHPAEDFGGFANHRSPEREECAEIGHCAGHR